MTRRVFILNGLPARTAAKLAIDRAPPRAIVEIGESKRSTEQNARLWLALTAISRQTKWHGRTLAPEDWKLLFVDALHRETEVVPSIDGSGFVALTSSSRLTVREFADLITLVDMFAAEHDVTYPDEHF